MTSPLWHTDAVCGWGRPSHWSAPNSLSLIEVFPIVALTGTHRVNLFDVALFHMLIGCFEGLTGLPPVLNTSFNPDYEPLVHSPEQAIATFYRSGLYVLILGNFVLRK